MFEGSTSYNYYHAQCCSPAQLQELRQSASSAQLSLLEQLSLLNIPDGDTQREGRSCRGVYVLELNEPGFYYVGQSENIERRLNEHRQGINSTKFCMSKGGMKQAVPPLTVSR